MPGRETGLLNPDDIRFLEKMTAAVVQESRVPPSGKVGDFGPNTTGGTVIRPGGRACYPAFWIRDYAMSLDSGLVSLDEQKHMLFLTAQNQQDELWQLPSGSIAPPGSIPDHITFGGKPFFFPGTVADRDFEGQGGPLWGKLPCLDDAFFFIHMASVYVRTTHDIAILDERVRGKTLLDRLDAAFIMPPAHADTGLVWASDDERGINFGFFDTVVHTGDLLFCSLLRLRAARELAEIHGTYGNDESAWRYKRLADTLRRSLSDAFSTPTGMLRASTGTGGQPDVWGTAFAVYIGALDRPRKQAACEALARAYRAGTIAWRGSIRQVPTDGDFSDATAWQTCLAAKNRYQNGAYWGTATGWVCYAIAQVDRGLAKALAREYVEELRVGDFRKGPDFGSPWECMHPDGDHRQNPVYMTSVTCPLAALKGD